MTHGKSVVHPKSANAGVMRRVLVGGTMSGPLIAGLIPRLIVS